MTEQVLQTKQTIALQEKALPAEFMAKIGLRDSDLAEVAELSEQLNFHSDASVLEWGHSAAEHTVQYADRMLDMVRTKDLDNAGKSLSTVLGKAKSINTSGLAINRSRVPLIGGLIDKFRVRYSTAMAQFSTAREAIDETSQQIGETQTNLQQRIKDLDEAFSHVEEEYHLLGRYIGAGRMANERLSAELQSKLDADQTPMSIQEISDLRATQDKLQKRLTDLIVLQQNALNTLPAIRLVQTNNATLIEKYQTITTLTIPTWKRQMSLGLALEEQSQAVELAEDIDNFTNDLLKQQANMLKKNTIQTAKANKRLVIDLDTITHVQSTLIDTVTEVTAIQDRAQKDNEIAVNKILGLRQDMNRKLTAAVGADSPVTKAIH